MEAKEGRAEFPNLHLLTSDNVDEWAELAESLNHPRLRARFADAVWELGRRLGSTREDLYRFGQLASEAYIELAATERSRPIEMLNAVPRSIQLATKLGARDLVDRGYQFLMQYADSVDPSACRSVECAI